MIPRLTLDPAPLADVRANTRDVAPHFVRELIDDVLKDTAAQLATLDRAAMARDAATCRSVAHHLLTSCFLVGACQLAFLLEEMELLAKDGAVAVLASQFGRIQMEYARLELALEAERALG